MNSSFHKERFKRIIKALAILFCILCVIWAVFFISLRGSDLAKGSFNIVTSILLFSMSARLYYNVKHKLIESDNKVVAVVIFLGGLVYLYTGIHKILRAFG
jgi:predicted membrane protein